jgi:energy-coupling factor transporter transmembrane protein EcfT
MNNQSKFSLADVLTLLAALAFGFVCFLSTNFYTLGNITQSIAVAAITAVVLIVTAFSAKLLKRTSGNFKTCFILEIISLVLFTGLTAFFAYSPFPHYFAVSEQKTKIQSKLTESITQAENMFAEYEKYANNRENLYKNKLRSVAAAKNINPHKYAEYGFEANSVANSKQIDNKMFTLHAELFPSNFLEMKQVDSTWLANARNIVNSWKPIGIVNVVNEVEKNSTEWLNELVQFSAYRGKGEQAKNFVYSLSFDDAKEHFTVLGKPALLSIGLVVLAYLLMLLSYFITKRSTKSTISRGGNSGNRKFDVEF